MDGTLTINKANAVIVVTPYDVIYDGNPHTATGTATGVESPTPANLSGLLNLSGTTHTDPGSYTDTWTFAGNVNYASASGTITDVIAQSLTVSSFTPVSPNPRTTPVSFVDVTFSLPIDTSSPTAGAVTLTDNGNPVAVSGVSFTLVQGTTSTYQIGDLSAFTAAGRKLHAHGQRGRHRRSVRQRGHRIAVHLLAGERERRRRSPGPIPPTSSTARP